MTTGLLQTISTILGSLWPHISDSGQGENTCISSQDAKVKSSAAESFNTRTQDLIRYFPSVALYYSHAASPRPAWLPFFLSCTSLLDSSSLGLELVNNMPYVKNILTEWQFAWKRSKQRLVRMGVVWEWGIIWLPSSLFYILSKICFSGGESHKVAWYAHFQSFESYPWTWFSSYVGLCYSSRSCDGEMWTVRKGRPGLMTPCGLVQSFQYPSHKPWFIWTEQLHRPTNLIHWPSYNPRGKRGPEKNGVFRLIVLSTNARFTSTVLKCVCEEEYKMKTLCLQKSPFL